MAPLSRAAPSGSLLRNSSTNDAFPIGTLPRSSRGTLPRRHPRASCDPGPRAEIISVATSYENPTALICRAGRVRRLPPGWMQAECQGMMNFAELPSDHLVPFKGQLRLAVARWRQESAGASFATSARTTGPRRAMVLRDHRACRASRCTTSGAAHRSVHLRQGWGTAACCPWCARRWRSNSATAAMTRDIRVAAGGCPWGCASPIRWCPISDMDSWPIPRCPCRHPARVNGSFV